MPEDPQQDFFFSLFFPHYCFIFVLSLTGFLNNYQLLSLSSNLLVFICPIVCFRLISNTTPSTMNADDINKAQPTNPEYDAENFEDLKLENVVDAFGNEEGAEVKYKTLAWWYVYDLAGDACICCIC
jgi:hypothetical protein